jgi:hypothetical protein
VANDLAVINNREKPPGVYGYLAPINTDVDSRSSDIAGQILGFADVTIDIGRRKITRWLFAACRLR